MGYCSPNLSERGPSKGENAPSSISNKLGAENIHIGQNLRMIKDNNIPNSVSILSSSTFRGGDWYHESFLFYNVETRLCFDCQGMKADLRLVIKTDRNSKFDFGPTSCKRGHSLQDLWLIIEQKFSETTQLGRLSGGQNDLLRE